VGLGGFGGSGGNGAAINLAIQASLSPGSQLSTLGHNAAGILAQSIGAGVLTATESLFVALGLPRSGCVSGDSLALIFPSLT
jgi:hypothetical protein